MRPVSELFDLIAGTSTGGILAAALTVPDKRGRPKYPAKFVRAAYFEHGGAIFHRGFARSVKTLGGLVGPAYSPRTLERLLDEYLGGARLHETLTEILVTAYDMTSSTPWFFKTSFAKGHPAPADDPLLTQVVRATTAAPTFFPPLTMEGHCLIDGGVFAGNPSLSAYAEARRMYPNEKEFLVVSLGTGVHVHNRSCREVEKWGIAGWAVPIIDVMLNSSSASVDYEMRALIGREHYRRFQVQLDKDAAEMDDASPENLRRLDKAAQEAVLKQSAELERVCRALVK